MEYQRFVVIFIITSQLVIGLFDDGFGCLCETPIPSSSDSKTYQHGNRRIARDLNEQLQEDVYNKVLLKSIQQAHQIVYPKLVDKGKVYPLVTQRHKIRHHGTHEHVKQLTVQIVIWGTRYRMKLQRNQILLSDQITVKTFEKQHHVLTKTVEHCYYHGFVRKDTYSSVALSTCDGLKGVIQMHNETYVIQPLNVSKDVVDRPHVIFKASVSSEENCGNSQGLWLPFQELHKGQLMKKIKFTQAQRKHNGQVDKKQKLLRIGLVLDNSMHMSLEYSQQNMIRYAVDVANIMDMYYRELDFGVALTYLEFWNQDNQFKVPTSHRGLLSRFLGYKQAHLPRDLVDAYFFMTGLQLDDQKVGVAVPDSICSDRAVAVVKSGKPFEPQQTATILSHMAGHVLGVEHDEGKCVCDDAFGCIMSTEVLGAGGFHSRMFSTCSKADLDTSLDMGITSCLWGAPRVNTEFKQTCGNGIVERGEECDCGSPDECAYKDACCDPATCLLQAWAQCRSGPCCSNCSYLPSSHMCRPRSSECDVPEFCDGRTWDCPNNAYIADGHPCAKGMGFCSGGICPTVKTQCKGIWGTTARSGHGQCFERFNPEGTFLGHCGKDMNTGSYAGCTHNDMMCGLLHCEAGDKSPLYGSDKGFGTTNINANGIQYECKTVHGPTMMDMPNHGMVQDGTRCGHNKVCQRQSCQPLTSVPVFTCPSTHLYLICSGHGVCAPDMQCFCDHDWEGEDCSVPSNVTVVDSDVGSKMAATVATPPSTGGTMKTMLMRDQDASGVEREKDEEGKRGGTPSSEALKEEDGGISTTLLIIILATVVGGLCLVMGVTLLCYRRRSPFKSAESAITDMNGGKSRSLSDRKWTSSEEESEGGELPPPPVIIMDPDSIMPEKGILKRNNSMTRLERRESLDSEDFGKRASLASLLSDAASMSEDEMENDEIKKIFHEDSNENLSQLQESASFDFVAPPPPQPPPPQYPLPDYYPSPAALRRPGQLDSPGNVYESPYAVHHRENPYSNRPQQQNVSYLVNPHANPYSANPYSKHESPSYSSKHESPYSSKHESPYSKHESQYSTKHENPYLKQEESPYSFMNKHQEESAYSLMNKPRVEFLPQQNIANWRTALPPQTLSPPQSRIVKLKNLGDYVQMGSSSKAMIDLSPSPDDPPTHNLSQISPSTTNTSEEVHSGTERHSSGTEPDRSYAQSDHSPTSLASVSTQNTGRPSVGSLAQYRLNRTDSLPREGSESPQNYPHTNIYGKHGQRDVFSQDGPELSSHNSGLRTQYLAQHNHNDLNLFKPKLGHTREEAPIMEVCMPPPMNPINIRSILNLGHTPGSTVSRDSNGTPQGSANGDNSSFTGTGNSRNGYEKSSGYGSEQDPGFSVDDIRSDSHSRSASLSRSQSSSPPSYSAVIRTGPNQIQLVPAGNRLVEEGREMEGIQKELNRLLENLPRINAGSFERSPLQSSGGTPTKDDDMRLKPSTPGKDRSVTELQGYVPERGFNGEAKVPTSHGVKVTRTPSKDGSLEEIESLIDEDEKLN